MLERSKPKSSQYKDKWAVDVFQNWQAAREKKILLLESGSVIKDFQTHMFGYLITHVWICFLPVIKGHARDPNEATQLVNYPLHYK